MHVALIIDEERLEQEQAMLSRLCIGLMAEGVQVTRIVPDRAMPEAIHKAEQRIALARRVEVSMRVLPWMRGQRVSRLAEKLEKHAPDVLYAVGEQAWTVAIDLARTIGCPVVLDVWSAPQVRSVPLPSQAEPIAGYVTCLGALARTLGDRAGSALVSMVPMGVSMPPQPRAILNNSNQMPSLAIIGRSRDVPAYVALFEGLSQLVREGAMLQIFLELRGGQEHTIWKQAQKFDLLQCISAISDASTYRALLTSCDVLLMPEHMGELRSIMLEAMALGLLVVSSQDQCLDPLVENETALLIKSGSGDEWSQKITFALAQPERARRIGLGARQLVSAHHRSSQQVIKLIETLERAATGGTYRLPPKTS